LANANFWRDLSKQFGAIDDPRGSLRAHWSEEVSGAQLTWRVESVLKEYKALLARFDPLARRCGREIAPAKDSLVAWLEELRRRDINSEYPGVRVETKERGEIVQLAHGTIMKLAEASEILCLRLESEAVEAERSTTPSTKASAFEEQLAGLTADDPRNLLPEASRRALNRAHIDSERIRMESEALMDSKGINRHESEGQHIRNQANLQAARAVLRVARLEYSKATRSLKEFRRCMRDEIEAASNSLELHQSQHQLLILEFFYPEEKEEAEWDRTSAKHALGRDASTPEIEKDQKNSEDCKSLRLAQVATFLQACNKISRQRIYKRHLWRSAGHSKGRQFEYWQECNEKKATDEDRRNFNRILSMDPAKFIALLKQQKLIDQE
jgi:hypothetical protein